MIAALHAAGLRVALWHTPYLATEAAALRALEAHPSVTDEAGAMEAEGGRPRMVSGTRRNLKITTVEDLDRLPTPDYGDFFRVARATFGDGALRAWIPVEA